MVSPDKFTLRVRSSVLRMPEGHGAMQSIRNTGQVFSAHSWNKWVEKNPNRIYGFLICADEHEEFIKYIQKAWRTIDKLSGDVCEIFTLERQEKRYESAVSLKDVAHELQIDKRTVIRWIDTGKIDLDKKKNYRGRYHFSKQDVTKLQAYAEGNLLTPPDRTQCWEVVEKLFKKPSDIILPGLALFQSAYTKEAIYYNCTDLKVAELSAEFQCILNSLKVACQSGRSQNEIFQHFQKIERKRKIRKIAKAVGLKLSPKDFFDLLTGGILGRLIGV